MTIRLIPLFALAILASCSDSNSTPPISIATPDAERCEILDAYNCLLPWPSNSLTKSNSDSNTGLNVNLQIDSMPANKQGIRISPDAWNRNDGFSPSQMLLVQVPGLDLKASETPPITDLEQSLDGKASIQVIRVKTGERHLVFAELDANTDDDAEKLLIIRPMVQFERGERYIVLLQNLKDAQGKTIEAPDVFRAYRDNVKTDNPAIESRRQAMNSILDTLQSTGVNRGDLYLAWDFTIASVENITERALHIRDQAFALLGDEAPGFTVTDIINYEPCGALGCDEGQDKDASREIRGYFEVPSFMDSDDGGPGSAFYYADNNDSLPDQKVAGQTLQANFVCRIPRSSATDFTQEPEAIARAALYGHGLLGSAEEVNFGSSVNEFANEHGFVFCGTDWIGFARGDIGVAAQAFQDVSLSYRMFDRQQQGFLNFMFLARLMKHAEGLSSHPAFQAGSEPVFDRAHVFYDGDSQGGILGAALMALAPDIERGVLGVPGMSYSFLLRRSTPFARYLPFFTGSGTGENGGGYPGAKDQTFILSLLQMLWDRAEGSGFAYHIERPLPNTDKHAVLLQVAYGDHQVSMWAAEFMARSIGANLRVPATEDDRHPDKTPYFQLQAIPSGDYTGSAISIWDNGPVRQSDTETNSRVIAPAIGTASPPTQNLAPNTAEHGIDPHFAPRNDAAAKQQKSEFLRGGSAGKFIDTCETSLPCTTLGYIPGTSN
jgi:hypothetical protein